MDLNEFLDKTPKWALFSGAAVLLGLVGYGFYYLAFGMQKPKEEAVPETVMVNMPDPAVQEYNKTALEEFSDSRNNARRNAVEDYWDDLEGKGSKGDGLSMADELDPAVYSQLERTQIRNGLKTKEQIDAEHAQAAQRSKELGELYSTAGGSGYTAQKNKLTPEQQDSLYMARLDQAYKMAAKYSNPGASTPEPSQKASASSATAEEEEQERKLDLEEEESAVIPTDSWADDGIISSLEAPSQNGVVHYGGSVKVRPVKATFLKNEKLQNGNRVIIRLMEDMTLADGTVIPANKHITGTCSIGKRMKINVTMLHYNNKMFPVDISVYDNDGTEGIYCPLVEEANNTKRKAKKVAQDVLGTAGTLAGTLITGNPILGQVATSGIRQATSSVGSDGSVSVSVSAGYEFYVYENVKEDKNKK